MASAIFGFVGVLLGSLMTSILTIYKDKLAARREIDLRDQQYQRDRRPVGRWFPGSGLLACSSMGDPKGWSEAVLQLELSRARVLDQQLRDMADQVRR